MNFEHLFNPASIAVIGASQKLSSVSGQPIAYLKAADYAGRIYPVNPRYQEVAGYRCYPDLMSLPETPHLVVIAVAAAGVAAALEQVIARAAPIALVLTSGFAETGEEGRRAQQALVMRAREAGVQLIGPNCQGFMNIAERIHVGFGPPYGLTYRKGSVSLVSQSGAFGNSILMMANVEGVGFRRYISTGNEAMTTSLDIIEHLLEDSGTRVIAGYVEGFQDAQRLVGIGRRALRAGKPLVMWKVGNSEAGARAALSHTANLGGSSALYRAAFRQAGVIEANDVGDLADCVKAFAADRLPTGKRMMVLSLSGGAGIAMADRCAEAGLELPVLDPDTVATLTQLLPPFASVANPLDLTGNIQNHPGMFGTTLERVARDVRVDMIGIALAAVSGTVATALAKEIVRIAAQIRIPVLVAWNADPATSEEAYRLLDEASIPRYSSPVRCARGAGALWQFTSARMRQQQIDNESSLEISQPEVVRSLATQKAGLAEYEAKRVLARYGIPVTREQVAVSPADAERIAAETGYPVVLKIQSRDIPHKTEANGVRVGVASGEAVQAEFAAIMASAASYAPDAALDGVLVQEMVPDAIEMILGVNNDLLFGPAVMVGLGGIFAEVFRDVSWRLAPVTLPEAHDMIHELRTVALLEGVRGRPHADIDALARTIVHLSALALDLREQVAEVDINPLFVLPDGCGVVAGDALIKLRHGDAALTAQPRVSVSGSEMEPSIFNKEGTA